MSSVMAKGAESSSHCERDGVAGELIEAEGRRVASVEAAEKRTLKPRALQTRLMKVRSSGVMKRAYVRCARNVLRPYYSRGKVKETKLAGRESVQALTYSIIYRIISHDVLLLMSL